ncbi:MAG TPA: universal stress protein [Nitrososphaerales archaeon]|nr:universal stress protein [Nitrososphaerales archaeon]
MWGSEDTTTLTGQNRVVASGFKKVLIASDGSDQAMKAFAVAEGLAKAYNAKLVVLTAVELASILPRVSPAELAAFREYAVGDAKTKVESLVLQSRTDGVDAKGEVLDKGESPVKMILEYAEAEGVDLIVVGTRGLGGFSKLLLGSVSSGLVSHAYCNVLIVK